MREYRLHTTTFWPGRKREVTWACLVRRLNKGYWQITVGLDLMHREYLTHMECGLANDEIPNVRIGSTDQRSQADCRWSAVV